MGLLELFQAQKLHSCLLKKGVRGLQSIGLEAGDFNKKKKTGKWICVLNVEEKKIFFMLLLDFWSEKLKFNCASKNFTVKNIR